MSDTMTCKAAAQAMSCSEPTARAWLIAANNDGAASLVRSDALLGELWAQLKDYDQRTTESIGIALTAESCLHSEGQRIAVRYMQSWLLAHGYEPNT